MTLVTVPRERALVGWHFMREDPDPDGMGRIAGLAHGGFRVRVGVEYVTLTPKTCYHGFHASERAIDALRYSGPVVSLVRAWGEVDRDDDKWASSHRVALWAYDATEELRAFARSVALAAVEAHWPDAPAVVVDFLATGDEGLRAAAGDAARAAAGTASWAARAVAGDTLVAWAAARAAAENAAWAAAGDAWDAARAAAGDAWAAWAAALDAAGAAMNEELESLLVSGAAARGLL